MLSLDNIQMNKLLYIIPILALLILISLQLPVDDKNEDKPNVVLITADAIRSDYIDCENYEMRTPNLCDLKADSVDYQNSYTHASYTTASMAAVFTGKEPWDIDMMDRDNARLPEETETLTEFLQDEGYTTRGKYEIFAVDRSYGFDKGFDSYRFKDPIYGEGIDTSNLDIKENREFLFVHLFGGHQPFMSDEKCSDFSKRLRDADPVDVYNADDRSNFSKVKAEKCYVKEIENMDRRVGEILDSVNNSSAYNESMIIFISDHGKGLWDREAFGYSWRVYEEQVDIEMLVKYPNNTYSNQVVNESYATLKNIKPTIEQVISDEEKGISLIDLLDDKNIEKVNIWSRSPKAVIWDELKLIENKQQEYELYNLSSDSEENIDLNEEKEIPEKMKNEIQSIEVTTTSEYLDSRKKREWMEKLGYTR